MAEFRPWPDIERDLKAMGKSPDFIAEQHTGYMAAVRKRSSAATPAPRAPEPAAEAAPAAPAPGGGGFLDSAKRAIQAIDAALPIEDKIAEGIRTIERPAEALGQKITETLGPMARHAAGRAVSEAVRPYGRPESPEAKSVAKRAGRAAESAAGVPGGLVGYGPQIAALSAVPEVELPAVARVLPKALKFIPGTAIKGGAAGAIDYLAKARTGEAPPATPSRVAGEAARTAGGFVEAEGATRALGAMLGPVIRAGKGLIGGSDWFEGVAGRSETENAGSTAGATPPVGKEPELDKGEETPPTHQKKEPSAPQVAPLSERTDKPGSGAGGTPPDDEPVLGPTPGSRSVPPAVSPGDATQDEVVPTQPSGAGTSDQSKEARGEKPESQPLVTEREGQPGFQRSRITPAREEPPGALPSRGLRGPVTDFLNKRATYETPPAPEPRNIVDFLRTLKGEKAPEVEPEPQYEDLPRNPVAYQQGLPQPQPAGTSPGPPAGGGELSPSERALQALNTALRGQVGMPIGGEPMGAPLAAAGAGGEPSGPVAPRPPAAPRPPRAPEPSGGPEALGQPHQDQGPTVSDLQKMVREARKEARGQTTPEGYAESQSKVARAQAALDAILGKPPPNPKKAAPAGRAGRGGREAVQGKPSEQESVLPAPSPAPLRPPGPSPRVPSAQGPSPEPTGGGPLPPGEETETEPGDEHLFDVPPPVDSPGVHQGAETTIHVEGFPNTKVRYEVVEKHAPIASHDPEMNDNPLFNKALQRRARDRPAYKLQVQNIRTGLNPEQLMAAPSAVEGAPVVGSDNMVEGGNGRMIALQGMGATDPNYLAYVDRIMNNSRALGLDPEEIDKFDEPVLIRRRLTELNDKDRADFAEATNDQPGASLSTSEQAMSDARRLTPEMLESLSVSERGDLNAASNRGFIRSFVGGLPRNRANELTDQYGMLSDKGLQQVQNAVVARAYTFSDRPVHPALQRMFESVHDDVKTIQNGLLRAAPTFAQYRGAVESGDVPLVDVMTPLLDGASTVADLRARRLSIKDWLNQGQLAENTTLTRVMKLYDEYRNADDLMDALQDVAYTAMNQTGRKTEDMFGAPPPLTPDEAFDLAKDPDLFRVEQRERDNVAAAKASIDRELKEAEQSGDKAKAQRLREEQDLVTKKPKEPC